MSHFIVLSDLHVGERLCSLREDTAQQLFIDDVKQYPVIEELILLGDIFELNLAPWSKVLDGKPGYFEPEKEKDLDYRGLRSFLEKLAHLTINKIVYLPGNHDYYLLQALKNLHHEFDAIRQNHPIPPKPVVRVRYESSFLNGLFPEGLRNKFTVAYPEHLIVTSTGQKIVLTHGHHLDKSQTLYQDIEDAFKDESIPLEERIINYESRIAAYQGIAHFQSKNYELRQLIETSYGLYRQIRKIWRWWQLRRHQKSGLRRKPVSPKLMKRVEIFVQTISKHKDAAAFIFGHTHDPDLKWSADHTRLVANCGSFLVEPKRSPDFVGTYVVIDNHPRHTPIDDRIRVRLLTRTRAVTAYEKAKSIKSVRA